MKRLIIIASAFMGMHATAQSATGDFVGSIVDSSKTYMPNVKIMVKIDESYAKAITDDSGKFRISGIPSGRYLAAAIFEKDTNWLNINIQIDGIETAYDWQLKSKNTFTLVEINKVEYKYKLIDVQGGGPTMTLDAEYLKLSVAKRDPLVLISFSPGVMLTDDGDLSFKGSRKEEMIYIVDGVKFRGVQAMPGAALKGLSVYTGGIPAKYGDTVGGVVVLETLGYFDLYKAWKSRQ